MNKNKSIQNIIMEKYLAWIKDNTFMRELKGNIVKITSPFLDARNDYIQIYIKEIAKGKYRLTDGGYLIADLESYGIELTPKRKGLFEFTINSYGVKYSRSKSDREVYIDTDLDNIGRSKHRLIQCLNTISLILIYLKRKKGRKMKHEKGCSDGERKSAFR